MKNAGRSEMIYNMPQTPTTVDEKSKVATAEMQLIIFPCIVSGLTLTYGFGRPAMFTEMYQNPCPASQPSIIPITSPKHKEKTMHRSGAIMKETVRKSKPGNVIIEA
mmetsp:Transcript_34200/g.46263  ORF Transcript_34200/g.46263 Transcript_34200/m.46263 type:complete len:107 (-) Transcript_34200:42-362(-)